MSLKDSRAGLQGASEQGFRLSQVWSRFDEMHMRICDVPLNQAGAQQQGQ